MPYTPLGLGGLILEALRTAVTDPALVEQANRVESGLADLSSQVSTLNDQLSANGAVDEDQQQTLNGIVEELQGLAEAIGTSRVVTEVQPAEEPTAAATE